MTDGIESAMAQAKAVAGNWGVLVHGAYTAQRAIEAGVLDELQLHLIPVLLGGGRLLFDVLPSRVELEMVRVMRLRLGAKRHRHAGGHPYPLRRPPLSWSRGGLLVVVGRGQLRDQAWALIEPPLPVSGRGQWWRDRRQVLNGIVWKLWTGAPRARCRVDNITQVGGNGGYTTRD